MVKITGNEIQLTLKRGVDESYSIILGENIFPEIARYLQNAGLASKYAIVTDSNVLPLHASRLEAILQDAGVQVETFSFPSGEENKNITNCMEIIGEMSRLKYGRDSAILALGGGVVGDMAGFMAGIFNRGIPYVQIPTTVLAQADSAVGGKTGIDTHYGKNLVGVFKQPERVFIDVATLRTLSDAEFSNGLAETIKHGMIADSGFFSYLERNMDAILRRETIKLLEIAQTNCSIKGIVVESDPHEKGMRRILNYGHTVGHAIEKLLDFKVSHGHCVSIGMMVAGRISEKLGYIHHKELKRQEDLLLKAKLPIYLPPHLSNEEIIEATTRDKKAKSGSPRYCLPMSIGVMHSFEKSYVTEVDRQIIEESLDASRMQRPA